MDITKVKDIPQDLFDIVQDIKFLNNKVVLLGTASLESQLYFSDYDLFTMISKPMNPLTVFKVFTAINERTAKDPNFYFIEFKIQRKDGGKQKFYSREEMTREKFLEEFKDVDYCKGDYVVRMNNTFIELSIIYSFSEVPPKEKLIESLNRDVEEYSKEGKYYKVLKRIFAINKLQGNKNTLVELTKLFNSQTGKLYQRNSNLKALELMMENYSDPYTLEKIELNLGDLGLGNDISVISPISKAYEKLINSEGKKLLKKYV